MIKAQKDCVVGDMNYRTIIPNFEHQQRRKQIKIIMGLFDKLFGGAKKDSNAEPPKNINFTSSDKLMDEDQFWKIIQTTKDNSRGDFEEQQEELANELRKLTPNDIILFGNRFRYFRG